MCDPITLLTIGSTAIGVYGQVQQASAASANARFQSRIAQDNADAVTRQIRDASERAQDEEQQVQREGARVVANTRAALAANNLDLTTGSPLDTIIEASVEVERDAWRVRRNAGREIDDLVVRRSNQLNQASAYDAEAANSRTAGFVAGVGTALEGATGVAEYRASIA